MEFYSAKALLENVQRVLAANSRKAQGTHLDESQNVTLRDEANVLAALALRNGYLEELHSGLPGFSDDEMKKLMIETSARIAEMLWLRDTDRLVYVPFIEAGQEVWCRSWDRAGRSHDLPHACFDECKRCGERVRLSWSFCASCGEKLSIPNQTSHDEASRD